MYRLTPKKTNNKAGKISAILFFAAAILMFLSAVLRGIMPYLWIIQLLAIFFLIGAIYVVARYITKVYVYEIAPTDRGIDLTVSESYTSGKKFVTVCRIGLQSIKKVTVTEGENEKSALAEFRNKKLRFYDYRPDISPDKSIAIVSDEGGEDMVILLSYDATLLDYFSSRENRDTESR